VRFAPNGRWLAVAAADAVIYLFDSYEGYQYVASSYGHSSAITHLDWSAASDVVRSNDQGHELRFWSMPEGDPITLASSCRDLPWVSSTVTLGYHCQGIFHSANVSGVHAVDRSADGDLLVSADDLGQVNLFRYPCVRPEAAAATNRRSFFAHSSAALGCRWASDGPTPAPEDELVVSVGGFDLTLMQWRRAKAATVEEAATPSPPTTSGSQRRRGSP